ncbi:hypothetical protein D9M68_915490 [compost metagenome]
MDDLAHVRVGREEFQRRGQILEQHADIGLCRLANAREHFTAADFQEAADAAVLKADIGGAVFLFKPGAKLRIFAGSEAEYLR